MDNYLYDKLKEIQETDIYPCHMPGHKRNMAGYPMEEMYQLDITEIDGFDNLYQAEGILKEAMQRAADFYGSEQTYFLINGSSSGILAALLAGVPKRGKLLFGRNAHKSAYHALMLGEMQPVYLYPAYVEEYQIAGGITPEAVDEALKENPDCSAVFVTSPTYEGVLSDIEGIVKIAHKYQIPVIVDEAHGSHLPLSSRAVSSVQAGADIVIGSIHKTLPAPTQTALLHKNGDLIEEERLKKYMEIFQSSSPSYLLMAGMDQCFRILKREGKELKKRFDQNREHFIKKTEALQNIKLLCGALSGEEMEKYGIKALDEGKIVISVKDTSLTGKELYDLLLQKYHLQMEMAADSYVLAIMTIMDTAEGFNRLAEALLSIDALLFKKEGGSSMAYQAGRNEIRLLPFQAEEKKKELRPLSESAGKICAESIVLYPPGVPLIVPGEVITKELADYLENSLNSGLQVYGLNLKKTVPYIGILV